MSFTGDTWAVEYLGMYHSDLYSLGESIDDSLWVLSHDGFKTPVEAIQYAATHARASKQIYRVRKVTVRTLMVLDPMKAERWKSDIENMSDTSDLS